MIPLKQIRAYFAQAKQFRPTGRVSYADLLAFLPAWHRALQPNRSPLADQQPWMTFAAIRFLKRRLTRQMRVFEYGSGGSTVFFARHAGEVTTVEHDPNWGRQVLAALDRESAEQSELYFLPPEATEADASAVAEQPAPQLCAVAVATRAAHTRSAPVPGAATSESIQRRETCHPLGWAENSAAEDGRAPGAVSGCDSSESRSSNQVDPADPTLYCSSAECYRGLSFRKYVCRIDSWPDGYFDLVSVDGRARPACLRHAQPKVKPGGWLLLDNAERPHYQRAIRELRHAGWSEKDLSGPGPYVPLFWKTLVWQKPLIS